MSLPTGLDDQVEENGNRIVKPTNTALHQLYTFYTLVTASGGSHHYFGPYHLDVGCTSTSLIISPGISYTNTGNTIDVGASGANIYTFDQPTDNRAYCSIITNEAVEADGTTPCNKINCG